MQITASLVRKITVSEIESLDPISIYIEDYAQGKGKLIITCHDESWSYYWGAMGTQNLAQFILTADNDYLAKKLSPSTPSTINDDDSIEIQAKRHIIERRKEDGLNKEDARKLYDLCPKLQEYKDYDIATYSDIMYEIYGDEWWDCLPTKPNPKYQYLHRIIDVVKEALRKSTISIPKHH